MKRKFTYNILLSLFLLTIIFVIWYSIPKQVNHTFEWIQYQLGAENTSFQQTVKIDVKGTLQKSIFGNKEFKGTIAINGEIIPPPNAEDKKLQLSFKGNNGAYISYWLDTASVLGSHETFGELFINDDFSELTITKFEQRESSAGWNGGNGFMISAPATTRIEALEISNELMKKHLKVPLQ